MTKINVSENAAAQPDKTVNPSGGPVNTSVRTRHYVEFFVDGSGVGYRLKCTNRATCTDTLDQDRTGEFCAVEDWWENVGTDLLSAPRSTILATFDVVTDWRGYGEDADLFVIPKVATDE